MSARSSDELLNDDVYLKILSYLPVYDLLNNIPLNNEQYAALSYLTTAFMLFDLNYSEEFKHWKKEKNGGNGMKVEEKPAGADNFPQDLLEEAGQQNVKNWVTSYADGQKSQTIDIASRGIDVRLLDKFQPDIIASEWYCGRFDCGNEYSVNVQLLDKKHRVVKEMAFADKIPTGDRKWRKFVDIITDYGTGVRYVKFTHKSCDIRYWAGHYGGKFTMASVRLRFHFTSH